MWQNAVQMINFYLFVPFQGSFIYGSAVHGNGPHHTITGNSDEPFNDFIGDLIQKFDQFSAPDVFRDESVSSVCNQ